MAEPNTETQLYVATDLTAIQVSGDWTVGEALWVTAGEPPQLRLHYRLTPALYHAIAQQAAELPREKQEEVAERLMIIRDWVAEHWPLDAQSVQGPDGPVLRALPEISREDIEVALQLWRRTEMPVMTSLNAPTVIQSLLRLVHIHTPVDVLAKWSEEQRQQAGDWATAVHCAPPGEPLPARPDFVPKPTEESQP